MLESRHEGHEVERDLGAVRGRNAGGEEPAHDAGGREAGALGDVGHREHLGAALGHEIPRHAGQRAHPVRLDHLLDGGAALGQVFEERQPLCCVRVVRVIEAGGAPALGPVHRSSLPGERGGQLCPLHALEAHLARGRT